jgi:hypothetical protein
VVLSPTYLSCWQRLRANPFNTMGSPGEKARALANNSDASWRVGAWHDVVR